MMKISLKTLGALAAGMLCATPVAQPQPQALPPPATLAERVQALEREVASLSTGFELREAQRAPAGDAALATRVDRLEQSLERLAIELQQVERQADNALREASQARREAEDAQRTARSVESRVH